MNIEGLAVAALSSNLSRSDYLIKNINENDKIPSWDGEIYFKYYEPLDKYFTKDGLAKVAVQVKGHIIDRISGSNVIHYSIDVTDLKNYFNDGGAIFFVVYIDALEKVAKQIYYVSLLPKKILDIVRRAGNQKSVSVAFRKFPDDLKTMENTIRTFIRERTKQYILVQRRNLDVQRLIEQKKIKKFSFSLVGVKEDLSNFDDVFSNQDVYIYGNMDDELSIDIPVLCIDEGCQYILKASEKVEVSINGTTYYENIVRVLENGKKILKIGESFMIYIEEGKFKFKFNLNGNQKERLKDLKFFRELVTSKVFYINGCEQKIDSIECDLTALDKEINYYQEVNDLLDMLGIDKELEFDDFKEKDFNELNLLVKGLLKKETISGSIDFDTEVGLYTAKIGNMKILVMLAKEGENLFNVIDVNEIDLVQCVSNDLSCYVPLLFTRSKDELQEIENLDFEKAIEMLDRVDYNELVLEFTINCLLNLLNVYDETKARRFYDTAKKLSEWLLGKDYSDLNIINHLQLLKRERELNMDEKQLLYDVYRKAKNNNDVLFLFACSVIDDSDKEAKELYDKLNNQQKEFLIGRPIMKFFKEE